MKDDILNFYISRGLEVKLIRKDTSSSSSSGIPYKHEVYLVGNNILFVKYIGQIRDMKPYEDIDVSLFDVVDGFLKTHQNVQLVQNLEAFTYVSAYGRKKYSDWLESVADKFESIIFYKGSPLINAILASTKIFNKKYNNIKAIRTLSEFKKSHLESNKSIRSIREDEILDLLEDSQTNSKGWTHNIDNGRLTQKTTLIDENIILLNVTGESETGDVKIVGVSKKMMKPHIPSHHDKFFLLFDVSDFKNQSIKRRVETYNFLESIIDDIHAVIICNASTHTTISAKTVIATKPALKNKIFFEKTLKDAIAKALRMKGVEVIRSEEKKLRGSQKGFTWFERVFLSKKIRKIYELELKVEKLKLQQEQYHNNILLMLGRILWGKPFVQIDNIGADKKVREVYEAIELLHRELKDIASTMDEESLT